MSVSRFRNLSRVLVKSSRLFALCEAFFHLLQALINGNKNSDFLCDELFLDPFILSREALLNQVSP